MLQLILPQYRPLTFKRFHTEGLKSSNTTYSHDARGWLEAALLLLPRWQLLKGIQRSHSKALKEKSHIYLNLFGYKVAAAG